MKLPDFHTLVLNNGQQFTIAEREKYSCESLLKVQSLQNVNQELQIFFCKVRYKFCLSLIKTNGEISTSKQTKKKNQKYPKKPQQCYKIPFMSLNCICHSFLVVPRHLKSCCRGDQNQMLLIDNFTTAISKIIALSEINNYHTLASYDIFLGPGLLPFYPTHNIVAGTLRVKRIITSLKESPSLSTFRVLVKSLIIFSNNIQ